MNQINAHTKSGGLFQRARRLGAVAALAVVVPSLFVGCGPIALPPRPPIADGACVYDPNNSDWHNNGPLLQGTGIPNSSGLGRRETHSFYLTWMTNDDHQQITSARVDHGGLTGTIGATYVAPEGFAHVNLLGTIDCLDQHTSAVEARIDSVAPKTTRAGAPPYYLYQVSLKNPSTSTWVAACADDGPAIAVPEVWDSTGAPQTVPGAFTFACVGGAIGKCIDFGYVPWQSADLRDLHLACTRMVRADYCGNGHSATKVGVDVDVWDTAGIKLQSTTTPPTLTGTPRFEAAWDTHGAACYDHFRLASLGPDDCAGLRPPPAGATLGGAMSHGLLTCASASDATPTGPLHLTGPMIFNRSVAQ